MYVCDTACDRMLNSLSVCGADGTCTVRVVRPVTQCGKFLRMSLSCYARAMCVYVTQRCLHRQRTIPTDISKSRTVMCGFLSEAVLLYSYSTAVCPVCCKVLMLLYSPPAATVPLPSIAQCVSSTYSWCQRTKGCCR